MPKKKSAFDYVLYGIMIIAAVVFGCIAGKSFDNTLKDNGAIDIMAALNGLGDSISSPMTAINSALGNTESFAAKGALFGGIAAILYLMYTSTTKKRYHRKGVEHGSACWGGQKEKNIIQDPKDLYNNIIYADDIFMVVDRKKRDFNKKRGIVKWVKNQTSKRKEKKKEK